MIIHYIDGIDAFIFERRMRIRTFIIPIVMGALLLTGAELYKSYDTVEKEEISVEKEISEYSSEHGAENVKQMDGNIEFLDSLKRLGLRRDTKSQDNSLKYYQHPVLNEAVVNFFAKVSGSMEISKTILREAEKNGVSISLAFSLAWKESSFRPAATHVNSSGSIDRGLFQLNSKYFRFVQEHEVFDVEKNTKKGLSHLKYCIEVGGSEVVGLSYYNAGKARVTTKGAPLRTLKYIQKIMNYREVLEQELENYLDLYLAAVPDILLDRYSKISLTQRESLNSLYQ